MKIRFPATLAIIGMGAVLLARMSPAAEFPIPKVEFSADMSMSIKDKAGGQSYRIEGKLYSAIEKQRREVYSFGRKTVIIKTEQETLTVIPEQKVYMKRQIPGARKDPESMVRDGEIRLTKEGTEEIDGQTTTRYKLESTDKEKNNFSGYAWFNRHNIPVRFKGTAIDNNVHQDVEINYYNISVGKQNSKLFAVPGDYRLVPAGLGGMGGGPAQMTPEQIEQMKKMINPQNP